jgi:thiol:disulfide interchange protein DsbD
MPEASVHLMYHINTDRVPAYFVYQLQKTAQQADSDDAVTTQAVQTQETAPIKPTTDATANSWSWSETLSQLIESTKSLPLRLLLVFLLGVLLSFTPCIYPMIPITVGILHSQKASSLGANFMRASSYTLGLATTFALMGMVASYTGPIYGKLLVHPVSVLIIVSFLGYLALSMLGLYELHIPRFLQPKAQSSGGSGSLLSAFLFGTASGTIASPCVSPGLILLLSIVATLGSALLGFTLLFVFGIGLSTPLLLIGTFSSSLSLLPQAGMWMVEIKKMFGLLLFGVCFYYLANLVSWPVLMALAALFLLAIGIFYLAQPTHYLSPFWKKINIIIGFSLIIGAFLAGAESYQAYCAGITHDDFWFTNYELALQQAKRENKKMFIDFWARYCSICKKINSTVLVDEKVKNALCNYVPVKIDGTDESTAEYQTVKNTFNIVGFPAFLIVDPHTQKIEMRWSSELYSMPREKFIEQLQSNR